MELLNLSQKLLAHAAQIKLVILDVDGVLSDGKVYYSQQGDEIKNFNIKDGLGIKLLQKAGIKTAIITGRKSSIVERRVNELGIDYLYQAQEDKRTAFNEILLKAQLNEAEVAHVGDDLPDLPLMKAAGLGIAVADANWFVKKHADWHTPQVGGEGAIRAVAELILLSQEKLYPIYHEYLS